METAVLGEFMRWFLHRGRRDPVYHWRTSDGWEVDFVLESGARLVPREVKLTKSPNPGMAAGLEKFLDLFPREAARGYLVCLADKRFSLTRRVEALPWRELTKVLHGRFT